MQVETSPFVFDGPALQVDDALFEFGGVQVTDQRFELRLAPQNSSRP